MTAATRTHPAGAKRLASLDIIRGLIMVFMALDHVRLYFTNADAPPEDFSEGGLLLFLVRWITHFCAPGFFFLAGVGVFLFEQTKGAKEPVVKFLISRGIWLVLLEVTLIGFAWSFNPGWNWAGVIWSLGFSFIFMAALVFLPRIVLLFLSLGVLLFHDAVAIHFGLAPFITSDPWIVFLYTGGIMDVPLIGERFILYSIIPWLALMALGYAVGGIFKLPAGDQRKILIHAGIAMTVGFLVLRLTNLYGTQDPLWLFTLPGTFSPGDGIADTIASLLNANKYHASLQFVLMTIGPMLVMAGWLAQKDVSKPGPGAGALRALDIFGRVPFFYYILHLYLIHILAFIYTLAGGFAADYMFWDGLFNNTNRPDGYGFGPLGVLLVWGLVVRILYYPCRWFQGVKSSKPHWWLKYL